MLAVYARRLEHIDVSLLVASADVRVVSGSSLSILFTRTCRNTEQQNIVNICIKSAVVCWLISEKRDTYVSRIERTVIMILCSTSNECVKQTSN